MPVYRIQLSWQADTAFARDRMMITPHFDGGSIFTDDDADALCEDLLTALAGQISFGGETKAVAYKASSPPPQFPVGDAIRNTGQVGLSGVPRELAVVMSFYNTRNAPRRRGRLYWPAPLLGLNPNSPTVPGNIEPKMTSIAGIFQNLGGADVDWCIWSRMDQVARPVTHWYVDNEWDVQRSRGLRATSRYGGTTSEG
jgi:hypothetical protein